MFTAFLAGSLVSLFFWGVTEPTRPNRRVQTFGDELSALAEGELLGVRASVCANR